MVQRLTINMMMLRWRNYFVIFVSFLLNYAQIVAFKFRESD